MRHDEEEPLARLHQIAYAAQREVDAALAEQRSIVAHHVPRVGLALGRVTRTEGSTSTGPTAALED